MTKSERKKLASELGKASWKSRKKSDPENKHLKKIASEGGKNRWKNKAKIPA
jgi:hypothetical protein